MVGVDYIIMINDISETKLFFSIYMSDARSSAPKNKSMLSRQMALTRRLSPTVATRWRYWSRERDLQINLAYTRLGRASGQRRMLAVC